jgi:hypothetical protein
MLFCFTLVATSYAEFITRRDATITALESKHQLVTVLIPPKARTTRAKPANVTLYVIGERIFRQLPSRRKIPASFADLQVGQRVIVSGVSSPSGSPATEIIILPPNPK